MELYKTFSNVTVTMSVCYGDCIVPLKFAWDIMFQCFRFIIDYFKLYSAIVQAEKIKNCGNDSTESTAIIINNNNNSINNDSIDNIIRCKENDNFDIECKVGALWGLIPDLFERFSEIIYSYKIRGLKYDKDLVYLGTGLLTNKFCFIKALDWGDNDTFVKKYVEFLNAEQEYPGICNDFAVGKIKYIYWRAIMMSIRANLKLLYNVYNEVTPPYFSSGTCEYLFSAGNGMHWFLLIRQDHIVSYPTLWMYRNIGNGAITPSTKMGNCNQGLK